jgi:ribosomal protein S18 acetylase RimI-like enzyme
MQFTVESLSDSNMPLWLDFFDQRALKDNPDWDGCYCQAYLNSKEDEAAIEASGVPYQEAFRKLACERQISKIMQGYVAIQSGKVIGWLEAGPGKNFPNFPPTTDLVARAICFTIDPQHRGVGLAKALLTFALDDFKNRGFEKLEVRGVPEGQDAPRYYPGAIKMYEKFGFVVSQQFDDGYVLMEKRLN